MRVMLVGVALVALSVATPVARPWSDQDQVAQPATATPLSDDQAEAFLRDAKVVKTKSVGKGVTGTIRATLTDGTLTHDAQIQQIEEKKTQFEAAGASEFNFEDSWRFNVAAYRVDRLIGLQMVPVTVSRKWKSAPAAFTWWIDDVMMDEGKRLQDKTQPPDSGLWNEQMQMVRVFDQLIYNVDRNMGNLLIGKNVAGVGDRSHTRVPYSKHAEGARERDALRPAGRRRSQAAKQRGPQEVDWGIRY